MSGEQLRSGATRVGILVATVLATWGVLVIGRATEDVRLEVGQPADQDYLAPRLIEVTDQEATEAARDFAYNNEPSVYAIRPEVETAVGRVITDFFLTVQEVAQPIPVEVTTTTAEPSEGDETTTTVSTTTTTLAPEPLSIEEQVSDLGEAFPNLQASTIETMVAVANQPETGIEHLERLRDEAILIAQGTLRDGLRTGEVNDVRAALLANPPFVRTPLELTVDPIAAREAVTDVVAQALQPNEFLDEPATVAAREAAAAAVPEVKQTYQFGEPIVEEGDPVNDLQLMALQQAGLLRQPAGFAITALLSVVVVLVAVLAFYLARFRPDFWARPKRVALFGLLVVLSALAARAIAILLIPGRPAFGYLVPAAAFGFLAAILFEPRMAVLMAVAAGSLTGVATHDPEVVSGSLGYALFALLATLVPVPFVSAISARADYRRAVGFTALALAPMAGTIAWFFNGPEVALTAFVLGLANGLISGTLAIGMLSLLETIFDATTSLTLLDLTDRNHPALQLLEEKATGTFNHSLMVGTLADRAARRIGANPLLARAAAYYHDLGKTENPRFYIENQFGVSNPHDSMPPEESAAIIRQHIEDGMRLARRYGIPADVAEGVVAHHGTGLMRYFYHKARERYGEDVDADRYRHRGVKPQSREMTILMLADAVEGACRAMVLNEEPTADGIRSTIEKVVGEKLSDGQLDQSKLTLGDLREAKEAFAVALIGHYHQRIPYPGFPDGGEGSGPSEPSPRSSQRRADLPYRP